MPNKKGIHPAFRDKPESAEAKAEKDRKALGREVEAEGMFTEAVGRAGLEVPTWIKQKQQIQKDVYRDLSKKAGVPVASESKGIDFPAERPLSKDIEDRRVRTLGVRAKEFGEKFKKDLGNIFNDPNLPDPPKKVKSNAK